MPTKSVSMVKLDNFPVFSTKTRKNQLLQKKSQNLQGQEQFFPFSLKFFLFYFKKSTDSLKLIYKIKKGKKRLMSRLEPLCPATFEAGARRPAVKYKF
jgi:hypothetical protein